MNKPQNNCETNTKTKNNFNIKNPIMMILNKDPKQTPSMHEFVLQQQKLEQERINNAKKQKKLEIVKKYFGMNNEDEAKNRPTIDFLENEKIQNITNLSNDELQNIIEYIARQNIACAFGCCGDKTQPERVEEIGKIFSGKIPNGNFLHFHLYQENGWTKSDWEKVIADDSEEALEYFQVYLKNFPQDENTKNSLLEEFKRIFNIVIKEKNDNK